MASLLRRVATTARVSLCPTACLAALPFRAFNDQPLGKISLARSTQDAAEFDKLVDNNRRWADTVTRGDPEYFQRNAAAQQPTYLWIGCSDSRVPAETLTGLGCGEIFVHRNVGNLVVNTDINMLSVLSYAIEILRVRHVVVCGHYGCGGIKAACRSDTDFGIIEHWLRSIRDVQRLHWPELAGLETPEDQYRRLVELNVAEQCINLFKTGIVQHSRRETGYPLIHGLVYELKNGLLQELNLDLLGYLKKYKDIYKLY